MLDTCYYYFNFFLSALHSFLGCTLCTDVSLISQPSFSVACSLFVPCESTFENFNKFPSFSVCHKSHCIYDQLLEHSPVFNILFYALFNSSVSDCLVSGTDNATGIYLLYLRQAFVRLVAAPTNKTEPNENPQSLIFIMRFYLCATHFAYISFLCHSYSRFGCFEHSDLNALTAAF